MIKGQTAADSQKFHKQCSHFPPVLCFPPAGYKQHLKTAFCVNVIQTSKNDNRQKEAGAICSVRQKHSTKVWSAAAQAQGQSLFVPGRSLEGVREGGEERGKVETGGAKSLGAVQVN